MVITDYLVVSGDLVSFGLKIACPATASENFNIKVKLYVGTVLGCQVKYGRKKYKSKGETKAAPEEARQGHSSQTA
jgi:hypothetical protein